MFKKNDLIMDKKTKTPMKINRIDSTESGEEILCCSYLDAYGKKVEAYRFPDYVEAVPQIIKNGIKARERERKAKKRKEFFKKWLEGLTVYSWITAFTLLGMGAAFRQSFIFFSGSETVTKGSYILRDDLVANYVPSAKFEQLQTSIAKLEIENKNLFEELENYRSWYLNNLWERCDKENEYLEGLYQRLDNVGIGKAFSSDMDYSEERTNILEHIETQKLKISQIMGLIEKAQ